MTPSPDEAAVLDKIADLGPFEELAGRLHHAILRGAPDLQPRLWYGMPGYAKSKKSPVVCFFRVDDGTVTFGVTEKANLDDLDTADHLIASAWYLTGIDEATEDRIAAIAERAAG